MKDIRDTEIPEFKSPEQEKEYWEARGPLAEGHQGTIHKPRPKQKRSSFLAVRLTGEELTRLRDIAAKQGLGPSTFARIVLTSAIDRQSPAKISTYKLTELLENLLPQSVKEKGEVFFKNTKLGDLSNPTIDPAILIIDANQQKEYEEFQIYLLKALQMLCGIQIITPEKEDFDKLREFAKAQTSKDDNR
jgi:hypothetical protein